MVTKPTEETVLMAKELALTEPNEERRGLLLSLVSLLAGRYFDKEQLKKWFLKEAKMIRTNTFIDDWLEEAEERGEQKGRQEGEQQGYKKGEKTTQRRLLLRLLERRFGGVPVDLVLRTEKLLTTQLTRLFDLAVDAKSLDEIEQAMTLAAV
jgi:predicted transposase YdaD